MSLAASPSSVVTSPASRLGAGLALIGGLTSLIVLGTLHVLRPDLAPGGHVVSEYGVGSSAAVGATFFAAQSLGCLGMAVALIGRASSFGVRAGIALLVLAAIGLGMAVFFPIDPLTTPPGEETFAGMMHGVAALIGIPSFIAATLVLAYALRKRAEWSGVGGALVLLAHLTWIALALMAGCMILLITQGMTFLGDYVGWANRLLVLAYAFWLMVAAWPLLKSR